MDVKNLDKQGNNAKYIKSMTYHKHHLYFFENKEIFKVYIEVNSSDKNYEEFLMHRSFFGLPITYGNVTFIGHIILNGQYFKSLFIEVTNDLSENNLANLISLAKYIVDNNLCSN